MFISLYFDIAMGANMYMYMFKQFAEHAYWHMARCDKLASTASALGGFDKQKQRGLGFRV